MDNFPWGVVLAVFGVVVPIAAFLYESVFVGRKRLGYREVGAASGRRDLVLVRIDGHEVTLAGADQGAYPFWETEYVYTCGELPAGSLAASFLRYLTNEVGMDIVRSHGDRPCAELRNPLLCRPS